MLDVADNLERAAGAVPAAALRSGQEVDPAEVQKQLRTLLEGVKMTQQVLNQVATGTTSGAVLMCQAHHSTGLETAYMFVWFTGFQTERRRAVPSGRGDV